MNYIIIFLSGAVRKLDDLDLKYVAQQVSVGAISQVISVREGKVLVKTEKGMGWAAIPDLEEFSDEEVESLALGETSFE